MPNSVQVHVFDTGEHQAEFLAVVLEGVALLSLPGMVSTQVTSSAPFRSGVSRWNVASSPAPWLSSRRRSALRTTGELCTSTLNSRPTGMSNPCASWTSEVKAGWPFPVRSG